MELYEYDDKEKEEIDRKRMDEEKEFYADEGDEEENKVYVEIKVKLKKMLAELKEQETAIEDIKYGLSEKLKEMGEWWFNINI